MAKFGETLHGHILHTYNRITEPFRKKERLSPEHIHALDSSIGNLLSEVEELYEDTNLPDRKAILDTLNLVQQERTHPFLIPVPDVKITQYSSNSGFFSCMQKLDTQKFKQLMQPTETATARRQEYLMATRAQIPTAILSSGTATPDGNIDLNYLWIAGVTTEHTFRTAFLSLPNGDVLGTLKKLFPEDSYSYNGQANTISLKGAQHTTTYRMTHNDGDRILYVAYRTDNFSEPGPTASSAPESVPDLQFVPQTS